MKDSTKCVLSAAAAAAGLSYLFLTAPGHASKTQKAPFQNRYFAHRGFHDKNAGIPENSLPAFRLAATCGYGVELDVRLTGDGQVVVCHDDDLTRLTGRELRISEMSYEQLQRVTLQGSMQTVPLFSEVLDVLCQKKVPVIIEVKSCEDDDLREELCQKTLDIMDCHNGSFCVESFDPFIVGWFRRNAPEILRGQLNSQRKSLGSTRGRNFALNRMLTNFIGRPQFIAHRIGPKSVTVKLWESLGTMSVSWTSREEGSGTDSDSVIFENYRPPVWLR